MHVIIYIVSECKKSTKRRKKTIICSVCNDLSNVTGVKKKIIKTIAIVDALWFVMSIITFVLNKKFIKLTFICHSQLFHTILNLLTKLYTSVSYLHLGYFLVVFCMSLGTFVIVMGILKQMCL